MAERNIDFSDSWYNRIIKSLEKNIPPRESTNAGKPYVFHLQSGSVFLNGKYVGQGTLKGTNLFVEQYTIISASRFSLNHITNLN
jgi:hypothetical protein